MVLKNIYGIGGLPLEWFKDYLRNREVQVLIGNSVTEAVGIPLYHRDHVQAQYYITCTLA